MQREGAVANGACCRPFMFLWSEVPHDGDIDADFRVTKEIKTEPAAVQEKEVKERTPKEVKEKKSMVQIQRNLRQEEFSSDSELED